MAWLIIGAVGLIATVAWILLDWVSRDKEKRLLGTKPSRLSAGALRDAGRRHKVRKRKGKR
jgi:hypothetical protein